MKNRKTTKQRFLFEGKQYGFWGILKMDDNGVVKRSDG
jgi:hypothetical protein